MVFKIYLILLVIKSNFRKNIRSSASVATHVCHVFSRFFAYLWPMLTSWLIVFWISINFPLFFFRFNFLNVKKFFLQNFFISLVNGLFGHMLDIFVNMRDIWFLLQSHYLLSLSMQYFFLIVYLSAH